ncbi:YybH family protein [Sphingomonas sp. Tas61C01]|uniref:YybH family protein n=1 Tax=Sphingomonas sp. Tas61C01 TaxID=3458297 RepID=UPI00403E469E
MIRSSLMIAALVAAPVAAQTTAPQAAVQAAMAASTAGWNAGDLDRFVAAYANDAMYVTSKGVVRGKAAIAERYRPSFTAGGNSRGVLSMQMLAFRRLSDVHQLLVARWTLTPPGAGTKPETGLTTLVFERQPAGWKIISDHSS